MSHLISAIIPAYNAEKYIGKCIESIQNSDYTDLEIIIVNDGSKDNTLGIINSYAKADSRIVVVDKENGGVSSARNLGLDRATGEYVAFIDSDDYVSENYFSNMLECCEAGADIACCRYQMVDEQGNPLRTDIDVFTESFELTPQQIAEDYFKYLHMGVINFSCNKLIRRSVIGDLRFSATLKWGEDGSFVIEVFKKMGKMHVIPAYGYFYVMHSNQTTARKMKGYGNMMIEHIGDIDRYIKMYDGYKNERVCQGMGRCWLGIYHETVRHCDNFKEYKHMFYKFKEQPWYQYVALSSDSDFKWKLMRKLVVGNHSFFVYFFSKMHSVLLSIKKRIKK